MGNQRQAAQAIGDSLPRDLVVAEVTGPLQGFFAAPEDLYRTLLFISSPAHFHQIVYLLRHFVYLVANYFHECLLLEKRDRSIPMITLVLRRRANLSDYARERGHSQGVTPHTCNLDRSSRHTTLSSGLRNRPCAVEVSVYFGNSQNKKAPVILSSSWPGRNLRSVFSRGLQNAS